MMIPGSIFYKIFWPVRSKFKLVLKFSLLNSSSDARVRFAPSPTGHLHIGGARTALFNYLFAKHTKGKFILRIEDTDNSRTIPGTAQGIENDLSWLSIIPDESPIRGGPYGPYVQSDRFEIYKKYSKLLLANGTAYKCFCSNERLKTLVEARINYDNKCRSLTPSEISELEDKNRPHCIRLKLQKEATHFNDLIYGERELKFVESEGDIIIMKSNSVPTYHLAHVIDDHLMNITHVLRGSEWIASVSKHLQLYKSFDWKPPIFGHLPNVLNPDKTKLSKRQQDIHIGELRRQGYSSNVVLNLTKYTGGGFEDIDNESLASMDELINQFRPNCIKAQSAILDMSKLNTLSRLEFRRKVGDEDGLQRSVKELKEIISQSFKNSFCADYSDAFYKNILLWGQDRVYKLNDFTTSALKYLWTHPELSKENFSEFKFDSKTILFDLIETFEAIESSEFTEQTWSKAIISVQRNHNLKKGPLMKLIRIAVCDLKVGPSIGEVFSLLGKEIVLHRLKTALSFL